MTDKIVQVQDSRRTFVNTLNELAKTDPNIIVVTCDVGFNYLTGKENFRLLNLGITEASSAIIAATLAMEGSSVWFYSMIPFVTFRVHEMMRNAVYFHRAPLKVLGVMGGPSYKMLGHSHNLLWENEDIEMMQKLMKCHTPQGNDEVRETVIQAYHSKKANYIRL